VKDQDRVAVGILGASGYIGAELMRYVALHPRLDLAWATANRDAGRPASEVFPNLRGFFDAPFLSADAGEDRIGEVRIVFLTLPHHESQQVLPGLVASHPDKIWIDLAGDFRSPDAAGYARYFGRDHAAPELLDRFVYGFTEAQREALAGARLIANPGCFATGMLLGLWPLVAQGIAAGDVCLTGITGSSGSGRQPSATTHHPERAENLRAYKTLVHQHLLEVESFLRKVSGPGLRLQFVPQSAPIVRGILTTVFLPDRNPSQIRDLLEKTYASETLIDVIAGCPDVRTVAGTPRSVIGVDGSEERGTIVFSAIDNLGKGAAGQAIQNLNCAMGWQETAGLCWPGGFV
jgi:N-acetyl-gamma-glutamyl-phosphate reductase common form